MEYKSKFNGEQADALLDLVGQGGGGSEGGSSWKYYDASKAPSQMMTALLSMATSIKGYAAGTQNIIIMSSNAADLMDSIIAICFCLDAPWKDNLATEVSTLGEILESQGLFEQFAQMGLTEISKEEFYTL